MIQVELETLIDALQRPEAHAEPVDAVEVIQTHISVVFLAGDRAYKVKKPVDMGFLDYTTAEKRRQFCEEEVRLNRRLAPGVYLGVRPIVRRNHEIRVGSDRAEDRGGEVVDHAVEMVRLPSDRTFAALVERGDLTPEMLRRLAGLLVGFYARADSGSRISRHGDWPVVAGNSRENLEQIEDFVGSTLSRRVFERLRTLTEAELEAQRSLIHDRARRDVPRETHGDLRLEHVYLLSEGASEDLVVVDCIEFNERFRDADPVADIAMLVMDLQHRGRRSLARSFADAYFEAAADPEGRRLLPRYTAYRHVVRGKVSSLAAGEEEIPTSQAEQALRAARRHFIAAYGTLAAPPERPALVLVGGLPGVGKSTVARGLTERADFVAISSDATRKRLAGISDVEDASDDIRSGIYTAAWTRRTYRALLEEAQEQLFEGRRVVVDASFKREAHRRLFLGAAARLGVPGLFVRCTAGRETTRQRLTARDCGTSDAGWKEYLWVEKHWEAPGERTLAARRDLSTEGSPASSVEAALQLLARDDLL